MEKLELKDLHPILQMVYECGCEIENALGHSIRPNEGIEKTVLNITHDLEKNRDKPVKEKIINYYGEEIEVTDYPIEAIWRINFCYMDRREKIHPCFSSALDVNEESEIIEQSHRIARELQTIYELPYTPQIFRDGKLVD